MPRKQLYTSNFQTLLQNKNVLLDSAAYTYQGVITPLTGFYDKPGSLVASSVIFGLIVMIAPLAVAAWFYTKVKKLCKKEHSDDILDATLTTSV